MWVSFVGCVWGIFLGFVILVSGPAEASGLNPAFNHKLIGPERARGVIVWNHGRSIDSDDSKSPTPPYLRVLRDSGWDVLRFNRPRDADTLTASTRRLVEHVRQLKHKGYRRVALAGQSFGAFLALMAADASGDVDAVVATSPAAFGNFDEFYDSWRLNATRLYPLLERIKHARVMLFYFHGDDFDPGGRGERSRAILATRKLGFSVVDQPAYLVGHWASSTGLFLRRFGDCIRDFVDADKLVGERICEPDWGETPSAELRLPDELMRPHGKSHAAAGATGASAPAAASSAQSGGGGSRSWYGFYPNGREVLLTIENVHRDHLDAIYAIGPGIDNDEPAEWTRREGRIVGDGFLFDEKGKSTLRFRPRVDDGLTATWTSPDGKTSMEAALRRLDLQRFLRHAEAGQLAQPQ
ncbi:MAG: alpha/beta hydrolase [Alphaproteobacteria bacterium]|nr:alpha/beta hydrolase [Alphaproteobacteria bacterium]